MNESVAVSSGKQGTYCLPPELVLPDISDTTVVELAREIESSGFAVLPSYISGEELATLRRLVISIINSNNGEYTVLTGKSGISNTLLETIGATPHFISLMRRVYEAGLGMVAPAQSLYQVLRCISGKTGLGQAYFFHYDSYAVTALLPIIVPEEGQTGDLLMKPNQRNVRSLYLVNLIDKLLVDNKFSQKIFRRQAETQRGGFIKVRIVPGNLYLFWGYRSLHANEPCDPMKIRATALFHFGDPHVNSRLRKLTGRARVRATIDVQAEPAKI